MSERINTTKVDDIFVKEVEGLMDPQEVVENIPIDEINKEADEVSRVMCYGTTDLFVDEEWLRSHPILKKRLNEEIESLRVLVKMRKSDEITHDILLRSIGGSPSNASLYKALTTIQSTLLSIQKQIDETKANIQKILTNVQQELFKEEDYGEKEEEEEDDDGIQTSYRGSKRFIEDMKKNNP